jgi:hypothetical protein
MYLRFPQSAAGRYENRVPQTVKAPGLPKLPRAGSIPKSLIHRGLDEMGSRRIPVLSNVSTPDLTVDEGNDILQKPSGVFEHQMKHMQAGVAFRRWISVTDPFVRNV